jgi:hypothetical protein
MMWSRIASAPIVTIGFGRNSVISLSRVPSPPHRMKTGVFAIFNDLPPDLSVRSPTPSAAGFVMKLAAAASAASIGHSSPASQSAAPARSLTRAIVAEVP